MTASSCQAVFVSGTMRSWVPSWCMKVHLACTVHLARKGSLRRVLTLLTPNLRAPLNPSAREVSTVSGFKRTPPGDNRSSLY